MNVIRLEGSVESSDARTRQQVRDLVVEKGPVTASTIARVLGLTTAAVRRHLTILLSDNEIAEHEPGQVGRRGRGFFCCSSRSRNRKALCGYGP